MDRLPQEVIDRIAGLLPNVKREMATQPPTPSSDASSSELNILKRLISPVRHVRDAMKRGVQEKAFREPAQKYWTLASAAALSRRWQHAVEPIVYSDLHLGYASLQRLQSALERCPERRAYLRSLTVVLALTIDHWTECGITEDALAPLFSALGSSSACQAAVDLTLRFEAGHPALRHRCRQGIMLDCTRSGKTLGVAACIQRLDFTPAAPDTEQQRRNILQLHLTEQARLIAHFPNLQSVAWQGTESESQAERDAARDRFADVISALLPERSRITQVSLALRLGSLGARIASPSGVGVDSYEKLHAKLHAATARHVTDLRYAGVVGPFFFSQASGQGDAQWLALRRLTVGMAMLTPTGQLYFDEDAHVPGSELDTPLDWDHAATEAVAALPSSHEFCSLAEPDRETVVTPLLRAFAGLLARLPVLEEAQLLAGRGGSGRKRRPWAVCYCAPGRTSDWVVGSELDIERPRIWFVTGQWRPGEEVVRSFGRAGRGAGHGENASVIYWPSLEVPVRIGV